MANKQRPAEYSAPETYSEMNGPFISHVRRTMFKHWSGCRLAYIDELIKIIGRVV